MVPVDSSVGPVVVSGSPGEAEVAAIIAAIEMSWPRPAPAPSKKPAQSTAWRYSGRWWQEGRLPNHWS
jgi:hypothetical protein